MNRFRKSVMHLGFSQAVALSALLGVFLIPAIQAEAKTYPAWAEVTKGMTAMPGLLPLYYSEKEQKLYMEISKANYNKEFILPISIARGAGMMYLGGDTLNFGDQWIISFKRSSDRILVVRRNIKFKAKSGTPQAGAVETSYMDSIIKALPIRSEKSAGASVLVDLADLFMYDLAGIGVRPDRSRSSWFKVKAFPKNIEIEVAAVFTASYGRFGMHGSDNPVPDPRGTQIVIHYGLSRLEKTSYVPRLADDRIGYFLSTTNDFSKDVHKSPKVRYINRWHLEKEDPNAKLSVPKKPIIFWIEKTVPRKYRPFVREGILEWNKAFEKIGYLQAIECRDQQSSDDFDPEDIRYNTFRWIATSAGFAMGPSRVNPKTGQILDADIVFDESMVRYYRQDYVRTVGIPQGLEILAQGNRKTFLKLFSSQVPEMESRSREMELLYEQYQQLNKEQPDHALANRFPMQPGWMNSRQPCNCCMMGPGIQRQLTMLSSILAIHGAAPGGKVPEKFIGQAIKEVVMHEVGHTLGLRHNFKASTMLTLEQVNDPKVTSAKGMTGSIMDYVPANFALDPKKQGDYFPKTIGPYDYWAIEYGYKPIASEEEKELAKIASKSAQKELTYATDEDIYGNPDPRINLFDLGDPLNYAAQRMKLMKQSIKGLTERVVEDGEGYQRVRSAFNMLMGEVSQATYLTSQYIGGEYTARDHKGDPNARPPMQPIPLEKQQQALKLLNDEIFSDKAFQFPPELLRNLAPDHFRDSGSSTSYHFPVYQQVLSIQKMALSSLLDADTLRGVLDIELQATKGQKVLTLPQIFDSLTSSIWSEVPANVDKQVKVSISTIRRNLQRAHMQKLTAIVLGSQGGSMSLMQLLGGGGGGAAPADARSLARLHLKQINTRLDAAINSKKVTMDSYTTAHLQEIQQQIDKVLNADMTSGRP